MRALKRRSRRSAGIAGRRTRPVIVGNDLRQPEPARVTLAARSTGSLADGRAEHGGETLVGG
jgi:hypothetical protein